jgi:hypothetical protein
MESAGIDPRRRGEQLTLDEFDRLCRNLNDDFAASS